MSEHNYDHACPAEVPVKCFYGQCCKADHYCGNRSEECEDCFLPSARKNLLQWCKMAAADSSNATRFFRDRSCSRVCHDLFGDKIDDNDEDSSKTIQTLIIALGVFFFIVCCVFILLCMAWMANQYSPGIRRMCIFDYLAKLLRLTKDVTPDPDLRQEDDMEMQSMEQLHVDSDGEDQQTTEVQPFPVDRNTQDTRDYQYVDEEQQTTVMQQPFPVDRNTQDTRDHKSIDMDQQTTVKQPFSADHNTQDSGDYQSISEYQPTTVMPRFSDDRNAHGYTRDTGGYQYDDKDQQTRVMQPYPVDPCTHTQGFRGHQYDDKDQQTTVMQLYPDSSNNTLQNGKLVTKPNDNSGPTLFVPTNAPSIKKSHSSDKDKKPGRSVFAPLNFTMKK